MTPFELVKESDTIYGCHIDGVCGTEIQDFAEELKQLLLKYGINTIEPTKSLNSQISIINGNLLILDTIIRGSGKITNPRLDPVYSEGLADDPRYKLDA